jgi:hypothetical protein
LIRDDATRAATGAMLVRCAEAARRTATTGVEAEGTSPAHLAWMCDTAADRCRDWPLDKLSRWLGFVQGVLASRGTLSVEAERDFSRPLFHAAYAVDGEAAPETLQGPDQARAR